MADGARRCVATEVDCGEWATGGVGCCRAYASDRNSGTMNVFVKPVTGAAEEKDLHPSVDDERPTSWSPDGRFLVIDRRPASRRGNPEVAIIPLTGEHKPVSFINAPYLTYVGQISPGWTLASLCFTRVRATGNLCDFFSVCEREVAGLHRRCAYPAMATRRPRTFLLSVRWCSRGRGSHCRQGLVYRRRY